MPCTIIQVLNFKSPSEVKQLIDLKIKDEGVDDKTLLELCRTALEYSVHTGMCIVCSQ